MKRILSVSLLLLSLLSVDAQTVLTYELEHGICYVVGYKSLDASGVVEIPSTVEINGEQHNVYGIGANAFYGCTGLTSITIPGSVTFIGEDAFSDCTGLTSITIPEGVTDIGYDAFSGCTGLTSITIPGSVTYIGGYAFYNCTGLTSITIPESVTYIGGHAFNGCTNLRNLVVDDDNSKYDSREGCNAIIETATNILIIGFENSTIPSSVTEIGSNAFSGCTGLTSITIPEGVTGIGDNAFADCTGLTSITIPEGVTYIGFNAFSGCTGLTSITIPGSVTEIGSYAFYDCTGLTNVKIEYGVKTISNVAFANCANLKDVEIPNSVIKIGTSAFVYTGLTSITIPNSVTEMGQKVFYGCSSLVTVVLSNNMKIIDNSLFTGCSKLRFVNIPQSVTTINRDAFSGCSSLSLLICHKILNIDTEFTFLPAVYVPNRDLLTYYKKYSNDVNLVISEDYTATVSTVSLSLKNKLSEYMTLKCEFEGYEDAGDSITITGLEPNKSYTFHYSFETEDEHKYFNFMTVKTEPILFKTLPAKATSNTRAAICAEVNLVDEQNGVGFEWRRIDAPDLVPSSFATCAVHNGVIEGVLENLSSNTYYKYRPYYCSASGTYYYGEWIGFGTADAYVYFSPTVYTYEVAAVSENSARLRGYAIDGSDDIEEQGFEYWAVGGLARSVNRISVAASAGQRIEAVVDGLEHGTVYRYRMFVRTANETVYGEEVQFETLYSTGITETYDADADISVVGNTVCVSGNDGNCVVEIYTLSGRNVYVGFDDKISVDSGYYIVKVGDVIKKIHIR